ncbi:MAG: hypothetical protein ABR906_00830 [Terracidiphilus sp.]|jgi:regulation of enolase protein 1 (concanavalin A-like superfamily)
MILALALTTSGIAAAQQLASGAHGIFTGSTDIGKTLPGSTVFDPATGSYRMTGGGADLWGSEDDFHFDWVRISGDATLTADVSFLSDGVVPLEKAVLIFRQSLNTDSAYADIAIHRDGHTTIQFRSVAGGKTDDVEAPIRNPKSIRIERKGNLFTASVLTADGKMTPFSSTTIALNDSVYVGIGVCAHNANGLTTAVFSNVSLTQPAAGKK